MMMAGRTSFGMGTFDPSQILSGAQQWLTPSTAITTAEGVFTAPSTAFSSSNLATTIGVLAVPLLILLLLAKGHHGR